MLYTETNEISYVDCTPNKLKTTTTTTTKMHFLKIYFASDTRGGARNGFDLEPTL